MSECQSFLVSGEGGRADNSHNGISNLSVCPKFIINQAFLDYVKISWRLLLSSRVWILAEVWDSGTDLPFSPPVPNLSQARIYGVFVMQPYLCLPVGFGAVLHAGVDWLPCACAVGIPGALAGRTPAPRRLAVWPPGCGRLL